MVRILSFHCGGLDSIPGRGTEIPQAMQCGQKSEREREKQILKMLARQFRMDGGAWWAAAHGVAKS